MAEKWKLLAFAYGTLAATNFSVAGLILCCANPIKYSIFKILTRHWIATKTFWRTHSVESNSSSFIMGGINSNEIPSAFRQAFSLHILPCGFDFFYVDAVPNRNISSMSFCICTQKYPLCVTHTCLATFLASFHIQYLHFTLFSHVFHSLILSPFIMCLHCSQFSFVFWTIQMLLSVAKTHERAQLRLLDLLWQELHALVSVFACSLVDGGEELNRFRSASSQIQATNE